MNVKTTWPVLGFLGVVMTAGSCFGQEETPAGLPYSPYPTKVTVTKVMHFKNSCWKIAMAGGTWYFENGETEGKSGFNSAFDPYGNDWIGNDADQGFNKSPSSGGKHEYRGWPNFGEGNFDHPARKSGAKTKWVDMSGTEIPFPGKLEGDHLIMRSYNVDYEIEYHFFMSHAAIKVLRAAKMYAFLFEGPVGGEQEKSPKDYYVVSDGKIRNIASVGCCGHIDAEFGNTFPRPYFYLADSDPKDSLAFYAAVKGEAPATAGDEGWMQGSNMVIFSFGRDQDKRAYTGTAAVCVFGFQRKEPHAAIDAFIRARLADPFNPAGAPIAIHPLSDKGRLVVAGNRLRFEDKVLYLKDRPGSGPALFGMDGRRLDGNLPMPSSLLNLPEDPAR